MDVRTIRKLADRAGELEILLAPLEAELKQIKDRLKAEGDGTYAGREFEVIVATSDTSSLDTKKVKAALTPAQIADCTVQGTRTTVRIKQRVALKAVA